jgi:hypothetical protein
MDMMVTMIPDGFAWDEAVLERGDPLNRGLISLLVISDLQPILIGTAFIVQAHGNGSFRSSLF